jgi:hypothetical protein
MVKIRHREGTQRSLFAFSNYSLMANASSLETKTSTTHFSTKTSTNYYQWGPICGVDSIDHGLTWGVISHYSLTYLSIYLSIFTIFGANGTKISCMIVMIVTHLPTYLPIYLCLVDVVLIRLVDVVLCVCPRCPLFQI